MKIYTKTGDKGTTGLYGGTRVLKSDLRIESYGTVDELNSYLGLIRDQKNEPSDVSTLIKIQKELFTIGAILATPVEKEILKNGKKRLNISLINSESIIFLEEEIDKMNEVLPAMTHFVLPGGHTTVSYCHIARCICRRAERLAVQLNENVEIDEMVLIYLNRLSDYLFVLARKLTLDNKAEEIRWIP
jgi:cob(I)alamin adenosyltransferase